MCSKNSSKGPALQAVLCSWVKFLIVGNKYDDIDIRSFPQIWANNHKHCTHLGILPVLRLVVPCLREAHHHCLHDSDVVEKQEICGAWSENGLESDEYVSSRKRREKNAKESTFRMIAGNFFRILRSRHLRVIIFLSEHFPEIPLLENVRFSLY
jgi:hypothetical protein